MHIRDEQKGILFLILIFAIIAGVSVFIARLLRTDTVGKSLENDQVIRTLYVLDDGGGDGIVVVAGDQDAIHAAPGGDAEHGAERPGGHAPTPRAGAHRVADLAVGLLQPRREAGAQGDPPEVVGAVHDPAVQRGHPPGLRVVLLGVELGDQLLEYAGGGELVPARAPASGEDPLTALGDGGEEGVPVAQGGGDEFVHAVILKAGRPAPRSWHRDARGSGGAG